MAIVTPARPMVAMGAAKVATVVVVVAAFLFTPVGIGVGVAARIGVRSDAFDANTVLTRWTELLP